MAKPRKVYNRLLKAGRGFLADATSKFEAGAVPTVAAHSKRDLSVIMDCKSRSVNIRARNIPVEIAEKIAGLLATHMEEARR